MFDTPCTFGNKLIVEAYQRESGPRVEIRSGWATPGQKNNVKGLIVLVDAKFADGSYIPAGSMAYIKEETLHTNSWAIKSLKSDTFTKEFIIVPLSEVEFISPPSKDVA